MVNVKIKQLNDRVATNGVHFGLGPLARKLEPSEIVSLDEESDLFETIYATEKVEITVEDPTRPLKFESVDEARFCSPSFRPHDPKEEIVAEKARIKVAERLALSKRNAVGLKAANAAHAKKREQKASKDVVANRREERLKKLKEMQNGETNTT